MKRKSIAVITGGAGSIGSSIVKEFLAADYHVIFTYNKDEAGAVRLFNDLASNDLEYFQLN